LASPASEAPEADESQDEDDVEESEDETSSSTSLPPMVADEVGPIRKENVSTISLPRVLQRLAKPLGKTLNTSTC
jgi:hypothetical protein